MQYSVMSQGVIEFKQKKKIIKIPYILLHFFYNDDDSIDVHIIDESNFSYI